jgi:hypothetical protein
MRPTGMKSPYYGKLHIKALPSEVLHLWNTKDEEPPFCEPVGWQDDYIYEVNYEARELCRKIAEEFLKCTFGNEERLQNMIDHLVHDATLKDIGDQRGVTREGARQVIAKGLRVMRWIGKNRLNVYERRSS